MRTFFCTALAISAMALAAPAFAQVAGSYDGTYVGVSGTLSGGSHCVTAQTPAPLVISNGNAASTSGLFSGTVDARGHIILHTKENTRFEGQIDASGVATIGGASSNSCSYTLVWKKR